MKKTVKKKGIKNNKRNIFPLFYIILLGLIIIASILITPKITQYAIKDYDNYSTNFKIEVPSSHKNIKAGENVWFTIKLFNLGSKARMDVNLEYEILNSEKKSIAAKTETVAIETQASFVKQIEIPKDSPEGEYSVYAKVSYANGNEVFAEDTFNVAKENQANYLVYIIILTIIIISIMVLAVFLIKSKKFIEKLKLKLKIHNIVKEKSKSYNKTEFFSFF